MRLIYTKNKGGEKMAKKYTIREIAEYYSVTQQTIRNWVKVGLPHIKIRNVLRFDPEDTDRWLKEQTLKK